MKFPEKILTFIFPCVKMIVIEKALKVGMCFCISTVEAGSADREGRSQAGSLSGRGSCFEVPHRSCISEVTVIVCILQDIEREKKKCRLRPLSVESVQAVSFVLHHRQERTRAWKSGWYRGLIRPFGGVFFMS